MLEWNHRSNSLINLIESTRLDHRPQTNTFRIYLFDKESNQKFNHELLMILYKDIDLRVAYRFFGK